MGTQKENKGAYRKTHFLLENLAGRSYENNNNLSRFNAYRRMLGTHAIQASYYGA